MRPLEARREARNDERERNVSRFWAITHETAFVAIWGRLKLRPIAFIYTLI